MGWLGFFRRQSPPQGRRAGRDGMVGGSGLARRMMPRIGGRVGARGALGQTFSGAEVSRLTADWLTFPETADDIVQKYQRILVMPASAQDMDIQMIHPLSSGRPLAGLHPGGRRSPCWRAGGQADRKTAPGRGAQAGRLAFSSMPDSPSRRASSASTSSGRNS